MYVEESVAGFWPHISDNNGFLTIKNFPKIKLSWESSYFCKNIGVQIFKIRPKTKKKL